MSWSEFLQYAASPGIAAIVGAILSVVVEYLPEYDNLEPKWKRLVFFGLCMVVPLAATALARGEYPIVLHRKLPHGRDQPRGDSKKVGEARPIHERRQSFPIQFRGEFSSLAVPG